MRKTPDSIPTTGLGFIHLAFLKQPVDGLSLGPPSRTGSGAGQGDCTQQNHSQVITSLPWWFGLVRVVAVDFNKRLVLKIIKLCALHRHKASAQEGCICVFFFHFALVYSRNIKQLLAVDILT